MRRLVLPLAACLLLAGCAPTVTMTPAPQATATGCASLIVGIRSVQTVGTAERRQTDAQGTAAWGTPVSVTLRCGVETPSASSIKCYAYGGVDWLPTDSGRNRVLTTFDRTPGVQIVTTPETSINSVLPVLAEAVADGTRSNGRVCSGATDAATPAP